MMAEYYDFSMDSTFRAIGQSPTQNAPVSEFDATAICRVKSEVNPYDPGWASYLDQRSKRRSKPTVSTLWASAMA